MDNYGGDEAISDAARVRSMTLPQLRQALRARGLSPAGGQVTLQERLLEHLLEARRRALPPSPLRWLIQLRG